MISMADSITVANLPGGFGAYAGYCDGDFDTESELRARFPGAELVIFTVTGASSAHGVKIVPGADAEPGNVNAIGAALWAARQVKADPLSRPVVYADLATPGYSMAEVIAELLALGVTRSQYRVHTAHYTGRAHLCSAAQGCTGADGSLVGFTADGTQWTDQYPGLNGSLIDMSLLADDFFAGPTPPVTANWVFGPVRGLTALAGHTSVLLSFSSPGTPSPGAVDHYQVTIRKGGADVPSYPRDIPKAGNPQTWQGGSLEPATDYVAMVRARAADGGHSSPWASVSFTTGHA